MKRERAFVLNILSPEKTLFDGEVTSVLLPGGKEPFTVLYNHAPLLSTLQRGTIKWSGAKAGSLDITGGFVEVKNNIVVACVEAEKRL